MAKQIRRVVTGHDADGGAIVVSDETATCILERLNRPGVTLTNLWQTDRTPAPINGPEETVDGPLILAPPENGSVCRIVEFQPEDPDVLAKPSAMRLKPAALARVWKTCLLDGSLLLAKSPAPIPHTTIATATLSGPYSMSMFVEPVALR